VAGIVYGSISGAVLAVAALGFNLQFGVTNYANFAYGPMLTIGAFAAFVFDVNPLHFGFWPSEVLAVLVTGVISLGIGQYLFTPFFRRRPQLLFGLTVTFATALILDSVLLAVWGSYTREISYPNGALTVHNVGFLRLTTLDLAVVGVACVVLVGVHVLLTRTRLGRQMRALSDNESLATACGLSVSRILAVTWAGTGVLAGIAGLSEQLMVRSFDPTMGDQIFYLLVAAVIFGGIGRPLGAVAGAMVVGIVSQVSVVFVGEAYSTVSIFVVLLGVMLLRPNGLLGARVKSVFASA